MNRYSVSTEDLSRLHWSQNYPKILALLRYKRFLPRDWKRIDYSYDRLEVGLTNHLTFFHIRSLLPRRDCSRCIEFHDKLTKLDKECQLLVAATKLTNTELAKEKKICGSKIYHKLQQIEPSTPSRLVTIEDLKKIAAREAAIAERKKQLNDAAVRSFTSSTAY